MKTDMSKAYDMLEWSFIQALVHKIWFDHIWIQLMMECISLVQYKILLNDSLFFYRAQKKEYQTIFRILKEYKAVSDHQINFKKSFIQFGHMIKESFDMNSEIF